jgi:uncharacterized protein
MNLRCAAVLALASLVSASPVFGQNQPAPDRRVPFPTLTVTGEGDVSVKPDIATVQLGVMVQRPEAAAAQGEVNQLMQKVVDAIKEVVPKEQVQTSGLSLYPIYSNPRPGRLEEENQEPKISGYRAEIMVTLRIKDLARVGEAIDAGLNAGANRLMGITFEIQNQTAARAQALQQAVRSAQEKARAMAAAMDVQLGGVLEAIEGGAEVVRPMYAMEGAVDMVMARGQMPGTPVEAGQVQVRATVTLRYGMSGQNVARPGAGDEQTMRDSTEEPPRRRQDRISNEPAPSQPR